VKRQPGRTSHNHSPNYVVKDLNVCKNYGFMHTNIINKHFSKSEKIQDFHMIVDDDPVVVDESINFSFNNVNNEVVLVNNTKVVLYLLIYVYILMI
jgi:hypothetical protein